MVVAEAPAIDSRALLWDAFGYSPTPTQKEILDCQHKTILVAGGFRGGKSRTASVKGSVATVEFISLYGEQAVGQVAWLVGSEYEKCRAEFNHPDGSLLLDLQQIYGKSVKATGGSRLERAEIRVPIAKDSNRNERAGDFIIKTKSASDETSLGMESPVWIILCEAAQVSYDTYTRLVSRVSEAQKRFPEFGWLHMEGTFEGSLGWYPAHWEKWQSPEQQRIDDAQSFSLPSHSNTHIYPGGENDPGILKLKQSLPEDKFAERHLGVPVPPAGRVHPTFTKKNVRKLEYDPDLPLYIGIDPGYSGQPSTYCVEILQKHLIGDHEFVQWHLIDEIAINKQTMPNFTTKDVCDIAMNRYWWSNNQKHGVIDTAGKNRRADSVEGAETELWRNATGLILRNEFINILPGIARMDMSLKHDPISEEPGLLVDPVCQKFIAEMGAGPDPFTGETAVYMWSTDKNNEVMGKVPRDRFNDAIKAVTYLLVNVEGYGAGNGERIIRKVKRRRDPIWA